MLAKIDDDGPFDALRSKTIEDELDVGRDIFIFDRKNFAEGADWTGVLNEPASSFDFADSLQEVVLRSGYGSGRNKVFAHSLNIDKPRLGEFSQCSNDGDSGVGMRSQAAVALGEPGDDIIRYCGDNGAYSYRSRDIPNDRRQSRTVKLAD
jgi:hypothetical protein